MANEHSNENSRKRQHKDSKGNPLPHLNDAANADTGKLDQSALLAGNDAWKQAILNGDYELANGVEFGVSDSPYDVLVLVRKKLK